PSGLGGAGFSLPRARRPRAPGLPSDLDYLRSLWQPQPVKIALGANQRPDKRWPARTTAMAWRSPGRRPSRSIGPDTLIAAITRPVRSRIGAETLAPPGSA